MTVTSEVKVLFQHCDKLTYDKLGKIAGVSLFKTEFGSSRMDVEARFYLKDKSAIDFVKATLNIEVV